MSKHGSPSNAHINILEIGGGNSYNLGPIKIVSFPFSFEFVLLEIPKPKSKVDTIKMKG